MKIQEAIKEIKSYADNSWGGLNEAFEMAINALERQIPQKPIEDGYYDDPAVCPNCGCDVVNFVDNYCSVQFCHFCGQKLDLSAHPTEKGGEG